MLFVSAHLTFLSPGGILSPEIDTSSRRWLYPSISRFLTRTTSQCFSTKRLISYSLPYSRHSRPNSLYLPSRFRSVVLLSFLHQLYTGLAHLWFCRRMWISNLAIDFILLKISESARHANTENPQDWVQQDACILLRNFILANYRKPSLEVAPTTLATFSSHDPES